MAHRNAERTLTTITVLLMQLRNIQMEELHSARSGEGMEPPGPLRARRPSGTFVSLPAWKRSKPPSFRCFYGWVPLGRPEWLNHWLPVINSISSSSPLPEVRRGAESSNTNQSHDLFLWQPTSTPKLSIGHFVSLSSGVAERGLLETPKVTLIIKEISGVVDVFWGTKTNYILLTLSHEVWVVPWLFFFPWNNPEDEKTTWGVSRNFQVAQQPCPAPPLIG